MKKRCCNQVGDFDDGIQARQVGPWFFFSARWLLNIRSMRSGKSGKPPTMLLVAATIAMVPRDFSRAWPREAWYSPARMDGRRTTAMASRALVNDIKGVWRSGETRRNDFESDKLRPA